MSTITERFSDIAALAAVQQIVRQLEALVKEESGKRYTRSRDRRRQLWVELQGAAAEAEVALSDKAVAVPAPTPESPAIDRAAN